VKVHRFNWPIWAGFLLSLVAFLSYFFVYTFLSDPKADVIRSYDLVHAAAGINGQDIARPAEFLLDSSGTVRWRNLTENYWVRARPEQIIEVAKTLR
jgi:peroxiredoxin